MGLERLPEAACIIVANHASYIDGPLLFALPAAALRLRDQEGGLAPAARRPLLLGASGHHFVERRNRHEGGSDARRILRSVEQGQAIAFFPEGTFSPEPGLARFHSGAFARRGARRRSGRARRDPRHARACSAQAVVLPRWGRIEVEVLEPLPATTGAGDAAVRLRDEARDRIGAAAATSPLL